jgi:hypothetical protein
MLVGGRLRRVANQRAVPLGSRRGAAREGGAGRERRAQSRDVGAFLGRAGNSACGLLRLDFRLNGSISPAPAAYRRPPLPRSFPKKVLWRMFKRNHGPSDLRQAFDAFLATMPPDAQIRAVIASDAIEREFAAFDQADEAALREQKSYRRAGGLALSAGFVGAVVWAILLLPIERWLPEWSLHVMSALRFISLVLTFLAIWWINARGSLVKWMDQRSKAEEIRGQILKHVIEASAGDRELLNQALVCFKFTHLDWQLGFFNMRIQEYTGVAHRSDPYRRVAGVLSAAATVFGLVAIVNVAEALGYTVPYLSAALHISGAHRWEGGLSALASGVLAFVSARASMDRGALVAAFYTLAAADLDRLKSERLPSAEAAAAGGNAKEVLEFAKQVQDALGAEHRVWRVAGKGEVENRWRAQGGAIGATNSYVASNASRLLP